MHWPSAVQGMLFRREPLAEDESQFLIQYQQDLLFSLAELPYQKFGSLPCCRTPAGQFLKDIFQEPDVEVQPGAVDEGQSPFDVEGLFFWSSVVDVTHEPQPSIMETGTLYVWGITRKKRWVLAKIAVRMASGAAERAGAGDCQKVTAISLAKSSLQEVAARVYNGSFYGILDVLDRTIQETTRRIARLAEHARQVADSSNGLVQWIRLHQTR